MTPIEPSRSAGRKSPSAVKALALAVGLGAAGAYISNDAELFSPKVIAIEKSTNYAPNKYERTLTEQWNKKYELVNQPVRYSSGTLTALQKENELQTYNIKLHKKLNVIYRFRAAAQELYRINPRRTTLQKRSKDLDALTTELSANFNPEVVQSAYGLTGDRMAKVTQYARALRGKELLTLQLNEIIGTRDGKQNVALLDSALRNKGMQHLRATPSLHDKLASWTEYQLTQNAIDVARACDNALPEHLQANIQSIDDARLLTGNNADKVAWEYQVCMSADLARSGVTPPTNPEGRVAYMATMHLRPRTLIDLIRGRSTASKNVSKHVSGYVNKGILNYRALNGAD